MVWNKSKMTFISVICLSLIIIFGFNLSWRFPPYLSFYNDIIVSLASIFLFISLFFNKKLITPIPLSCLFAFILAFIWAVQPFFVEVDYFSSNVRASAFFILLGMLSWSIKSLSYHSSKQKIILSISILLSVGAIIQAISYLLQLYGDPSKFSWFIGFNSAWGANGQLGQRNLMAHYLMWGVLSSSYVLIKSNNSKILCILSGLSFLFLCAVIGYIASRSVFLYLIAVTIIAIVALLFTKPPVNKPVFAKFLLILTAVVLSAQLFIPYIMPPSSEQVVNSLQRVTQNFSDINRLIEWQKSWNIFLNHPIFGVGFDGYSFESFILDQYYFDKDAYQQTGYFSHSHNSLLQIMAEMGIIGTVVILGGLLVLLLPVIQKMSNENIYLTSLLAISISHSMVEYPLWNTNFLAVFFIFLSLLPENKKITINSEWYQKYHVGSICKNMLAFFGIISLTHILYIIISYQNLINNMLYTKPNYSLGEIRKIAMFKVAFKSPLLDLYQDQAILSKIEPASPEVSKVQVEALERIFHFAPASLVVQTRGLIEYRQGNREEAVVLLKLGWQKYPRDIPYILSYIQDNSKYYGGLVDEAYKYCNYYQELGIYKNYESDSCVIREAQND